MRLKNTCYLNAYGVFSFICVTYMYVCTSLFIYLDKFRQKVDMGMALILLNFHFCNKTDYNKTLKLKNSISYKI